MAENKTNVVPEEVKSALEVVVKALSGLSQVDQLRVLRTAAVFYGFDLDVD